MMEKMSDTSTGKVLTPVERARLRQKQRRDAARATKSKPPTGRRVEVPTRRVRPPVRLPIREIAEPKPSKSELDKSRAKSASRRAAALSRRAAALSRRAAASKPKPSVTSKLKPTEPEEIKEIPQLKPEAKEPVKRGTSAAAKEAARIRSEKRKRPKKLQKKPEIRPKLKPIAPEEIKEISQPIPILKPKVKEPVKLGALARARAAARARSASRVRKPSAAIAKPEIPKELTEKPQIMPTEEKRIVKTPTDIRPSEMQSSVKTFRPRPAPIAVSRPKLLTPIEEPESKAFEPEPSVRIRPRILLRAPEKAREHILSVVPPRPKPARERRAKKKITIPRESLLLMPTVSGVQVSATFQPRAISEVASVVLPVINAPLFVPTLDKIMVIRPEVELEPIKSIFKERQLFVVSLPVLHTLKLPIASIDAMKAIPIKVPTKIKTKIAVKAKMGARSIPTKDVKSTDFDIDISRLVEKGKNSYKIPELKKFIRDLEERPVAGRKIDLINQLRVMLGKPTLSKVK